MAELGSNRTQGVSAEQNQNQVESTKQYEGPTFVNEGSPVDSGQQQPQQQAASAQEQPSAGYVEPAAPTGKTQAQLEAERRAAEERARNEAQHRANDQKIRENAQKAQTAKQAPTTQQASTSAASKYTVYNEDHNGVAASFGVFNTPKEAEDAMQRMSYSWDPNGVQTWRVDRIDPSSVEASNIITDFEIPTNSSTNTSTRYSQTPKANNGKKSYKRKQNIPSQTEVDSKTNTVGSTASVVGSQLSTSSVKEGNSPVPVSVRDQIDDFFKSRFYSRSREARKRNKATYREMRKNEDVSSWEEFLASGYADEEAFSTTLKPMKQQHYRSNKEYEEARLLREEGQTGDIEESGNNRGTGMQEKDMSKLWNLLDQTVWDMKIGFFHVESEKLVSDERTGEQHIEWSRRVENAMNTVMEDFDGTGIDGQRTVFRLVRLYATMAIDRQGKMFNMDQDEWSLTQDEFVDICNCIHQSIMLYGHPFVMPAFLTSSRGNRVSLRGTDMFPSGVLPRVVADAITGPNSRIRHIDGPKKGKPMTADEAIDAAKKEWIHRTQPVMNANLVNSQGPKRKNKDGEEIAERNLVAQRIAIENALQAFARLDGVEADVFGTTFNIDTAQHYKLWEYQAQSVEYATAMNGLYDSKAINDLMDAREKKYQEENKERSGRKGVGDFEAAMNLMTSGIKVNALWWNLPIRISAIAERGVGNLQTWLTLSMLRDSFSKNTRVENYLIPDEVSEAFHTEDGYKAIDTAYILLEVGGPGALLEFSRTGAPMTQDEAIKYLRQNVMRKAKTERAAAIQELNVKLNKASQKILAGNSAFKQSTITNFLNALMISNQALAGSKSALVGKTGELDTYGGLSLTGSEMLDIFLANNGDIGRFMSEVVGTPAGRDALIMMNANNISQFNVVGYNVGKMLRDHGIGNAGITAFVDSFATYGINFLYSMIPGSRTFAYLTLKQAERKGDITAADFAIGGGMGRADHFLFRNDPGFYAGLKMNIMFDGITMGKWVLGGILVGGVMFALGFDFPDDPEDYANISKYKIGKNLGWGPDTNGDGNGDGVEIQLAFWLNDLTQWGLPIAYLTAGILKGLDRDTLEKIFVDSISDQFDGNVVLDIVDCIKNFGDDVVDIDQTMKDPTHEMQSSPFFAVSELGLRAFGKMVPGAPLYKAWGKSAALRGPYAEMYTTNRVYDKSSEWAQEVEKTDYIQDPAERLIRKYSAGNWLLAGMMNLGQMVRGEADTGTGYFWHQMPTRTKTEPLALALAEEQKMDYDNIPEGSDYYSYRAQRTEDLKKYIEAHYDNPEEAIRDGFFISGDIRDAALNTTFAELNALKNEFDAKCDLQFETKSEYYDAKDEYDKKRDELWTWINDWFKNDDIPTWMESYEQILSDWDISYVRDDGTPVTEFDKILDDFIFHKGDIQEKWKLKGNNPTGMLPLTLVNYESNDIIQRGWSGETKPQWETEGTSGSDYATLMALENRVIPVGRDAGSTVGDVYMGEKYDGERIHPDDITIGERAWKAKTQKMPESLKKINADNCDGGIYGDMGKSSDDPNKAKTETSNKPWKNDYGPNDKLPWKTSGYGGSGKSFYPRSSYGRGGSSNKGDYNPKIYSNPRSVNSDRAATMYTKQPQSARTTYLRPSFSTKGSREAYKRQDF